MFWVYILRCADSTYYTGHTDNLEKRLAEHHAGVIHGYTSRRHPVELVFQQSFPTRDEALAAEQQIKGWSRRKKEAMMRGDWQEVSLLALRGVKQARVDKRVSDAPEAKGTVRPSRASG